MITPCYSLSSPLLLCFFSGTFSVCRGRSSRSRWTRTNVSEIKWPVERLEMHVTSSGSTADTTLVHRCKQGKQTGETTESVLHVGFRPPATESPGRLEVELVSVSPPTSFVERQVYSTPRWSQVSSTAAAQLNGVWVTPQFS